MNNTRNLGPLRLGLFPLEDDFIILYDMRLRQRNYEVAAVAVPFEIAAQLVGYVPGEQKDVRRLVGVQLRLVEDGDVRAGEILINFLRAFDLHHAVEDSVVQADVVDESARARGRPDAVDGLPVALEMVDEFVEFQLGARDPLTELADPGVA